jgi:hypothetical protein
LGVAIERNQDFRVAKWHNARIRQTKRKRVVAQHFLKSRSDEWKLASYEVAGLCENNFASRQGRWKADEDFPPSFQDEFYWGR